MPCSPLFTAFDMADDETPNSAAISSCCQLPFMYRIIAAILSCCESSLCLAILATGGTMKIVVKEGLMLFAAAFW